MTSHSFEKPKGWSIAPQSTWVSGKAIGQSEVKMPALGDPGAHQESSAKVSFGDDDGGFEKISDGAMFRGQKVSQCPPGTSNLDGICTPDPESEAKPESRMKTAMGHQWGRDKESKGYKVDPSFKRKLPEAPMRGAVTKNVSSKRGE